MCLQSHPFIVKRFILQKLVNSTTHRISSPRHFCSGRAPLPIRILSAVLFLGAIAGANAALTIASLSPANGATDICPDTHLQITFNAMPAYTNLGRIVIYTAAGVPVDTNDMTLNSSTASVFNYQSRKIAGTSYNAYPIIVSNNTATIYPHLGVLTNNQTYYVNITADVFTNKTSGGFAGVSDTSAWSFTTKPTRPPAGTNYLVVAADNTGDFDTVQGAMDFLPSGNTQHVLIFIRKGFYQEIVFVNAKNNITFRGEDRKMTQIAYPNNNNLNNGSSTRSLVNVTGDDIAMENLTLTNSTPYGGSQAEALRMGSRRFILNNCDLDSFQDTLLVNSSARYGYFYNSHIQGDTDFIWNDACAVFQNCEIEAMHAGYNTQMRTPDANHYGAVFLDCSLTKANSFTGHSLGRIDPTPGTGYPYSACAYINCRMDTDIAPAGWLLTASADTSNLRYWEYQSTDLTGTNLINTSSRASFSEQLTAVQATALRNLTNVYGVNLAWLPQLAPNIISQPTNQTVPAFSNATFTVSATGIQTTNPSTNGGASVIVPLSYQWLKNGANLIGTTNATLTITNAQYNDIAVYSVIVSNSAGTMTSSNVTLTVTGENTPPTLAAISDSTINVGVTLVITNTAADTDAPPQTLTFSLTTGPTNATFDTNSGVFTWRPLVTQADTTNLFTVVVTDNGTPNLSATQSFDVTVNPLTVPGINSPAWNSGQFSLSVNGQVGPDYAVQTSTNLLDWSTLWITNPPFMPFSWPDPDTNAYPMRFYRIKVGPPLP